MEKFLQEMKTMEMAKSKKVISLTIFTFAYQCDKLMLVVVKDYVWDIQDSSQLRDQRGSEAESGYQSQSPE